jgi:hypothetical protein
VQDPGQQEGRADVQQGVRGTPRGDVETVEPVVQHVDRRRGEEDDGAGLEQAQRDPVDPVTGGGGQQRQRDHERGAE